MISAMQQIWDAMPPEAWAANALIAFVFLVLGLLLSNWLPAWWNQRRAKRQDFSGEWQNILYSETGEASKRDTLTVHQQGAELWGTITRDHPRSEMNRTFGFRGRIKSDRFVAIYWADDDSINRAGSWHVRYVADGYYSGLYVTVTPDNQIISKRLDFRRKGKSAPNHLTIASSDTADPRT